MAEDRLLGAEHRAATLVFLEHLAELDHRRLWAKKEYTSTYEYCVFGLKLSDPSAYRSIRAARALRLFPPLLPLLRDGRLSVEAVVMLHPHLEAPDVATLVTRACGLRIKQLEALLSERQAPGPARDVIRFVGAPTPEVSKGMADESSLFEKAEDAAANHPQTPSVPPEEETPPVVLANTAKPLRSVRLSFTANEDFYRLLARARGLLRHKYPDGRLEGVLGDALKALIERRDPVMRWQARQKRKKTSAATTKAPVLFS